MPETIVAESVEKFVSLDIRELIEGALFKETPFRQSLRNVNWEQYSDQRVLVKSCGGMPIPPWAFMLLMANLLPVAKSVAYGEDCHPVVVYKR